MMKRWWWGIVVIFLGVSSVQPAAAQPTRITVRVLAKDAKFIGSAMGGARITVRNAETGDLLAKGTTAGTTGDTDRIMHGPNDRRTLLADDTSARFDAEIDLKEPALLEIAAYGPLARRQAATGATVTQWVVPGKHLTGGNGVLLEISGVALSIVAPLPHTVLTGKDLPASVELRVHLVMQCGCPVTPGGLWDADGFEVRAVVLRDGTPFAEIPLAYAGETGVFHGRLHLKTPGTYEIMVYAHNAKDGNTGLDRTTIVVR